MSDDLSINAVRRAARTRSKPAKQLAPALFIGVQSGCGLVPDFELFNLTAAVGIYPAGSTVSRKTLETAGFAVAVAA